MHFKGNRSYRTYIAQNNYFRIIVMIFFVFAIKLNASNSHIKLTQKDTIQIFDTIYNYDTIFKYEVVYDTIFFYDTVFVEEMESLKILDSIQLSSITKNSTKSLKSRKNTKPKSLFKKISVDLITSYGFHNYIQSYSDPNTDINHLNKNGLSTIFNNNYSLRINYNIHKGILLSSGVSFSSQNDKFKTSFSNSKIDTSYIQDIKIISTFEIDTIPFLNIDTLIATGDTVWHNYYDSTFYNTSDTFLTEEYDTLQTDNYSNESCSFQFIEIPIIASYYYNYGNFNIAFSGGIINQILYKHKRYEIENNNDFLQIGQISAKELNNYSIALYISLSGEYKASTNFSILFEPYFKQTLLNIYARENNKLLTSYYGASAGIRYYF